MADIRNELEETLLDLCKYIRKITNSASADEIKCLPQLVIAVSELAKTTGDVNLTFPS